MPVKSKAQWKKLAKDNPELLRKWQAEHPVDFNRLPEHAKKKRK